MPTSTVSLPRRQKELLARAILEKQRRELVKVALSDLYSFNKDILHYEEMAENPHRAMCDAVCYTQKNRQIHLWPRGHFKSSMITVGDAVRRIGLNPNTRIFIGNAVLGNAKSFLREIKGHFERNEELRDIIGDQVSKDEKWSESQIIVKGRTKNLKEPTIQVAGVGQSLASQHYDVMYLDDLVDQLSVTTPEQMEKTIEWYKLAISLLEPDGMLIIIGTRYHFGDLYGWLLKDSELKDRYEIQVHAAIGGDGQPIFPTRFSPETLAQIKADQGSYIYSCQYMNSPVDDENAKFKHTDFRYYKEHELEGKELYTVYMVDRAYSLARSADFTSHVIVSVDLDNNWYVRYALRGRESEGKIIDRIFDQKDYFKVDKVGIEQKAFKDTLRPVLEEEMRRRDQFFTVEELIGRSSKISRIEGLVPRFENHSIYLLEGMEDLKEELLQFPSAIHDDLADALAYGNDLAHRPNSHKATEKRRKPRYDPRTGRVLGYV